MDATWVEFSTVQVENISVLTVQTTIEKAIWNMVNMEVLFEKRIRRQKTSMLKSISIILIFSKNRIQIKFVIFGLAINLAAH